MFSTPPLAARRRSNSSAFVFNEPSSIISRSTTCTGRLVLHVFRQVFPEAQKLQTETPNLKKNKRYTTQPFELYQPLCVFKTARQTV